MHIGIDARLTYYRAGGISTYIRCLIGELETLDKTNQYTIFHSRKATETVSSRFQRANLWTPSHHRIERLAMSVELARFNLDVFHSTDFIPPLHGAQTHVISIHDLSFLHYPQFLTAESRQYYSDQIQAAVKTADHILTISAASKQDIIHMLGVAPEKITVQVLGADDNFVPQSEENIDRVRRELELPAEYILFLGTFEPRKNVNGLLEAYRLLVGDLPDAPSLVLAGNRGWLFDDTMRKINSMKLHNRILFREAVPQHMLPALFSGAIVHTMPSFYEGFGLPALEAMSCGTLSIVSNRSSLPEVVGNVGILIDPDDPTTLAAALHRAVTDRAWRQQQEQAALEQAKHFSWHESAKIVLSVYQKVMN